MKGFIHNVVICFCLLFLGGRLYADTVTINFDNLQDSQVVGSAYASSGVIFNGAVVATGGISLNEADFPPHSGNNVVVDFTGPITLAFTTPISTFSGFFTYTESLTLDGFGTSNQLLATATSAFSQNFVSSGNPPNELISLSSTTGMTSITITGDPLGQSFALDDVSLTTAATVPEPGELSLIVTGVLLVIGRQTQARSRRRFRG